MNARRLIDENYEESVARDRERYNYLTAQMGEAMRNRDYKTFYRLQVEMEQIKSRYRGLPPKLD